MTKRKAPPTMILPQTWKNPKIVREMAQSPPPTQYPVEAPIPHVPAIVPPLAPHVYVPEDPKPVEPPPPVPGVQYPEPQPFPIPHIPHPVIR